MPFLAYVKIAGLLAVPALVGVYLFSYGLWAWRSGLRRGAIGAFLLVAVTFGLSALVIGTR